jgi:hypothetical protein
MTATIPRTTRMAALDATAANSSLTLRVVGFGDTERPAVG